MASKSENPNAGHRARLRARFGETGFKGFAPHEVLELLLTFAIPRKDVKPAAKALLTRFGSVSGVLEARADDLVRVPGIGETAAQMLRIVPAAAEYYLQEQMQRSIVLSDAKVVMKYLSMSMSGLTEEALWVLLLDRNLAMLGAEEVARGTIRNAEVSFRKIVELCLRDKATGVIFAHNHPGGTPYPSDEDIETTRRLRELLHQVDVALIDHIIVARKATISLRSLGYLDAEHTRQLALAAEPPAKTPPVAE